MVLFYFFMNAIMLSSHWNFTRIDPPTPPAFLECLRNVGVARLVNIFNRFVNLSCKNVYRYRNNVSLI